MIPVKITPEMAEQMAHEVVTQLLAQDKMPDGKYTYTANFSKSTPNAVEVNFTTEAYEQMFALINYFSSEVAWEGCVERLDETHFRVNKIVLYPQKVTGTTVTTTDEDYANWRMNLPDEIFNSLFFQAHSHVNMGVSPSSTDISDQWRCLNNLQPTDYQIFMILNKRHEYYIKVVDLAANKIYEGSDVKVTIGTTDTSSFLEEAKEFVKSTTTYTGYPNYTGGYSYYSGGSLVGGNGAWGSQQKTSQIGVANPATTGYTTVTGASAPKVSNLMSEYQKDPDRLASNYNSSCKPYLYDYMNDPDYED